MADIDIRLDTADMDRLINQLGGNAETWLSGIAEQIVTDVKLSFGTSPPGRVYERAGGRTHVASRPGYPPNVDIGNLTGSIGWKPAGPLARHITVGADYGANLEFGIGMAARPFLTPVMTEWRRRIHQAAREGLIP